METFLQVTIVVLIVGALAWLAWRIEQKRREALAAVAASLGARFDPSRDRDHPRRFSQFALFRKGSGRAAFNTISGDVMVDGRQFGYTMGDYRYTVQQGKHTHTYNVSYALVHLPFASVPDLSIRHEGVFDRIAGALGFDDIDFESAEFSRKFHVRSTDKRFAYDVIHPGMIDFLLTVQPPEFELIGGSLLIARGTSRWEPEEFVGQLAWARRFLSLWPDHITSRLT